MHNGVFYSLEEVIDFYDRGGDDQPGQKDPLLQKLDLTKTEKKDLLYFLKSLSSKKPPLQIKVPDLPEYEVIPPPGDE
jgi:cytochrome c peroxidase